jgi:outer membrane protein assembly factor BamD
MKKIFVLFTALLLISACSSEKASIKTAPLLDAETLFKQAQEKMKAKYYEEARKILETIKTQDISKKYTALAELRIGDTYFEEELYNEAVTEYEKFLEAHPHHQYASYAQYNLAMSYFKKIQTADTGYSMAKRALEEFETLMKLYPRNPYMSIVENRMNICKSILAEYEFYVGEFYFKKGSYSAAAERFDDLLLKYPESKKEPETLYYLGMSYKNMGETEKSQKALTALIEKFPTIELSKTAKEAISSLNNKKEEK